MPPSEGARDRRLQAQPSNAHPQGDLNLVSTGQGAYKFAPGIFFKITFKFFF